MNIFPSQISLLKCYQYLPDNNYPTVIAGLADTLSSLTVKNNEKNEKNEKNNHKNDSKGNNGRNGSNSNKGKNEKNGENGIIVLHARAYLAAMSVSVCPCSFHYWDLVRDSIGWFQVLEEEDKLQTNVRDFILFFLLTPIFFYFSMFLFFHFSIFFTYIFFTSVFFTSIFFFLLIEFDS